MNFSLRTKNEIIKRELDKPCCKIAALSGFLRTSGSVETRNGHFGFSAYAEISILQYFSKIINHLYNSSPEIVKDEEKESRSMMSMMNEKSLNVLMDTGIIKKDGAGVYVELALDEKMLESDCCKKAFIIGAFLGSGTVTSPQVDGASTTTSYHLECVFTQYITASDFSSLFGELGFMTKLIERKEYFVVYMKNAETVCDCLTLMGATNASLELTDIIMKKEIKNRLNRNLNCEMSNMNKAIDASLIDKEAINVIKQTIGLDSLPQNLKLVAISRLESEMKSLSDLAEELKISKSCLSHRLRKLREIAATLSD